MYFYFLLVFSVKRKEFTEYALLTGKLIFCIISPSASSNNLQLTLKPPVLLTPVTPQAQV